MSDDDKQLTESESKGVATILLAGLTLTAVGIGILAGPAAACLFVGVPFLILGLYCIFNYKAAP